MCLNGLEKLKSMGAEWAEMTINIWHWIMASLMMKMLLVLQSFIYIWLQKWFMWLLLA